MPTIRIAPIVVTVAIAGLLGAALYQSQAARTQDAQRPTPLLRVADDNPPDGTETQDPEQQEQQSENQQECGNPNGCG